MTLTAPWFLLVLLLLAPVALAFLVRFRRDAVRVPSTLLFRRVAVSRARSRWLRHLTRLLAMLACAGAVAALALAAARPAGAVTGATVAVVIDVSASMGEADGDDPLAAAIDRARDLVARAGASDELVIIAAGPAPTRLAGPTADRSLLTSALDRVAPTRGESDLAAAVDMAVALCADREGARVLVLHDGGISHGERRLVRDDVAVTQSVLPRAERDNLGIVALAGRPPEDARSDLEREVLVTVATSSDAPRRARVTLSADGVRLAERDVEVAAGAPASTSARLQADVGAIEARVAGIDGRPDALAIDDVARLEGRAASASRALVVTEDDESARAFFVGEALRAAGVPAVTTATPADVHAEVRPEDLVVVLERASAARVDAPTLFVSTRAGSLPVTAVRELGASRGQTHLRSIENDHPLTRGVELDGVTIETAAAVDVPEGARSLVELDGGTVVASGGAGRGRWVFLGVDPDGSDLVLRVAFPVLVANAIAVLGGAADVTAAPTVPLEEVTLRPAATPLDAREAAASGPALPASPATLLAALAAVLMLAELVAWRRGWAS